MDATEYLDQAGAEMRDRAASRDSEESGERSMKRTVEAFWALYGDTILKRGHMTETEGWQFMSVLKKARGSQGAYREDDYVDDVAYCALAAESASDANDKAEDSPPYRRLGWVSLSAETMDELDLTNALDIVGFTILEAHQDYAKRSACCLLEHPSVFDLVPSDTGRDFVPWYKLFFSTIEGMPYIRSVEKV